MLYEEEEDLEAPLEPAPERFARWTSLTLAGIGGVTLLGVAVASLLLWTRSPLTAATGTLDVRLLMAGLILLATLTGVGLLAAGTLHHHAARARANLLLTYEGLVEETSQEFDKVRAQTDRLAEAVEYAELRLRRLSERVEHPRHERAADEERGTGPEPVPVNVLGERATGEDARQAFLMARAGRSREQE